MYDNEVTTWRKKRKRMYCEINKIFQHKEKGAGAVQTRIERT